MMPSKSKGRGRPRSSERETTRIRNWRIYLTAATLRESVASIAKAENLSVRQIRRIVEETRPLILSAVAG